MLNAGDHIICSDDVYGGTFRLFDKVLKKFNLEFDFIDLTSLQSLERYIKKYHKAGMAGKSFKPAPEAYRY